MTDWLTDRAETTTGMMMIGQHEEYSEVLDMHVYSKWVYLVLWGTVERYVSGWSVATEVGELAHYHDRHGTQTINDRNRTTLRKIDAAGDACAMAWLDLIVTEKRTREVINA